MTQGGLVAESGRCKGVHCIDLGESFQTHIYLQNLASIQPRTSRLKFADTNTNQVAARADDDAPPRCAGGPGIDPVC